MAYKNLIIEQKPMGVTVLKISRPAALNALNTETLGELAQALGNISKDPSVRCLIFTGDGDKSFIAGADIIEMKDKNVEDGIEFAQSGHTVARMLETMPKPTIAAVNGFALGGGTEMAIGCDFILASDKAVFGQPEVGLGIIPGFGATFRLARFVGWPRAKELIFSGRRIKAEEALRIGLCNAVYKPEELMEKALELATQIASQSAIAVMRAKELMNQFCEPELHSKVDHEALAFGQIFGQADQREGMGAFAEKRKPKFQGL